MTIDGRPLTDYLDHAPQGYSTVLSWYARNDPDTVTLVDIPEGFEEAIQVLIHMAKAEGIEPLIVRAPAILREAGFALRYAFPEWLILTYYTVEGAYKRALAI